MRVHPDRFRMKPLGVRTKQAALVKALSERMEQPDFQAYQRAEETKTRSPSPGAQAFTYFVEKRDGTIIKSSISLHESVEHILHSMTRALEASGAASLPQPPALEHKSPTTDPMREPRAPDTGINHRYDKTSMQGRDLFRFLDELNAAEISSRKTERTNAQAAALSVRKLYQFAAVDATTLGWSSASVAVLLGRMMAMHEEHKQKFYVESFYPLRLVFSSDDFHDPLDTYGGLLRLNPASTTVQWIDTLRLITPEVLEGTRFKMNRITEMTRDLQGSLSVKFRKGFSCPNAEYYQYLEYLCSSLPSNRPTASSTAVTLESLSVTVEASQAYRRPKIGKDGSILVGAGTEAGTFVSAVSRLSGRARNQIRGEKEETELCKQAIRQMQWSFGVNRVFRTGVVSHADFLSCLYRLLSVQERQREHLQYRLSGNSLGVAGKGHFCHLSDDGSVVVPHDWSSYRKC